MEIIQTSEINDCSICATLNAAIVLGIDVSREEIKNAVRYLPEHGGHASEGLAYLAKKHKLETEIYPLPADLIYEKINNNLKKAKPETNIDNVYNGFLKRLQGGWVAVFQHYWSENLDHGVALVGVSEGKIKIACSVRGEYFADKEILYNRKRETLQGLFTLWVKRSE